MKTEYFLICIVWLGLFLSTCQKTLEPSPLVGQDSFVPPNNPPALRISRLNATVNGQTWFSDSSRCYHYLSKCEDGKGYLALFFYVFNQVGELREQIAFAQLPYRIGRYRVYPTTTQPSCKDSLSATFTTVEADGDVVKDFYTVLGKDCYVNLTDYNQQTGELRGELRLIYGAVSKAGPYLYPDTLRFENATFRTWITQWNR